MGNVPSLSSSSSSPQSSVATDKEVLERIVASTCDQNYVDELTSFLLENWQTLKTINLYTAEDRENVGQPRERWNSCLEATVRALTQIASNNRDKRALEKLHIGGEFDLDATTLEQLLWLAPKDLELQVTISGSSPSPATHDNVLFPWQSCELEKLSISECNVRAFSGIFRALANLSTLKEVSFGDATDDDDKLYDNIRSREATEALVAMLEHNPIEDLWLSGLLPEKTLFCEHLGNNESLKSLELRELEQGVPEHEGYFDAIAAVVKGPNDTLTRFEYERSDNSGWGPSSLEYYMTLNRCGRHRFVGDNSRVGAEFVNLLSKFLGSSSPHSDFVCETKSQLATLDERSRSLHLSMAALSKQWAYSDKEWISKDVCMIYGLLRQSPGGWASAAVEAASAELLEVKLKSSKRRSDCDPAASHPEAKRAHCASS